MFDISIGSKLSFIQKIYYSIFRQGLKNTLKTKSNRPIRINTKDIEYILSSLPKERWYDVIKPLIWSDDIENHFCVVNNDDHDNYPVSIDDYTMAFNLDDLKKDEFYIEPNKAYTHSKFGGICYCFDYIALDKRSKDYSAHNIIIYGNIPSCLGITDSGELYGTCIKSKHPYESTYHDYKNVNYEPIEGEILYYIKKITNGEISDQNKIDKFIDFIENSEQKFLKGDITNKKIFEDMLL